MFYRMGDYHYLGESYGYQKKYIRLKNVDYFGARIGLYRFNAANANAYLAFGRFNGID